MSSLTLKDISHASNLVESWIFVETLIFNFELKDSLKILNHELEAKYRTSRIWEWSRCENEGRGVQIPKKVRRYMSAIVLPHALKSFGLSKSSVIKIDCDKLAKILN